MSELVHKGQSLHCLRVGCTNLKRLRGVCPSCYAKLSRQVKQKLTTWQDLEQQGEVLAPDPDSRQRWNHTYEYEFSRYIQ